MARTYTASEVNPLKAVHTGLNVVRSRYEVATTAATLTVSDLILLARIPNKATVYEWRLAGGCGAAASTGTWKLGVNVPTAANSLVNPINSGASLTDDALHAAMSLTTAAVYSSYAAAATNIPFKVSLSDDNTQQYIWIVATTNAGSFTGTTSLQFDVKYVVGE